MQLETLLPKILVQTAKLSGNFIRFALRLSHVCATDHAADHANEAGIAHLRQIGEHGDK